MLTICVVLAGVLGDFDLGALRKPASIPDRWLLKLVPDTLPALPAGAIDGEWHERTFVFGGIGCGARPTGYRDTHLWLTPGRNGFAGEARVVASDPTWSGRHVVKSRSRLAVHGSLVEFGSQLYTARLTVSKNRGKEVRELLLGGTVELPGLVWYRAGTEPHGPYVQEWRAEFSDDPREKDAGKVTVRRHVRVWHQPDGESRATTMAFKKVDYRNRFSDDPRSGIGARELELVPTGDEKLDNFPVFVIVGRELRMEFGLSPQCPALAELRLVAGPPPPLPRLAGERPGPLMDPPKKR